MCIYISSKRRWHIYICHMLFEDVPLVEYLLFTRTWFCAQACTLVSPSVPEMEGIYATGGGGVGGPGSGWGGTGGGILLKNVPQVEFMYLAFTRIAGELP